MFYDRTLDHRIDRTQERALRIAYKDYGNDFWLSLGANQIGTNPCKKPAVVNDRNVLNQIQSKPTFHGGYFHGT